MNLSKQTIPLSRLRANPNNPRGKTLAPADWADLVPSIKEHGVIQPILIRPIEGEDECEIVAGERRYRAANEAFGSEYEIPYILREVSDAQALVLATIENMQRAPMSPAKEAEACQTIVLNLAGDKEEAARQMGWSVETLERRLALMACTQRVRDALTARRILLGHAELLAAVPPANQDSTLEKVIAQNITVQALKENLGKFARRLSDAPFDKSECAACPHNSNRQSQLFGEALGEGYCTHPTHYDQLVEQHVGAIAAGYRETCTIIRIVKPKDGFVPLPVAADGDLGVGDAQYASCKGCANFGCSISAMPGSYGAVTESLCFNAECNSKKIAARKKSQREAAKAAAPTAPPIGKEKGDAAADKKDAPSNKTPPRVLEYRVKEWRKWAANQLMVQHERNQRVMVAMVLSSHQSSMRSAEFRDAMAKITGMNPGANLFDGGLKDAEAVRAATLPELVRCVTASLAFGIEEHSLEVLLNYLEIEESTHFRLTWEFLDLFTKSELESLADELKLKEAMGAQFAKLRDGKRAEFIKGLLSVPGFQYEGLVPKVMRYRRKKFPYAGTPAKPEAASAQDGEAAQAVGETASA
jgi:PRTRC genetic system ParB family protein